MSGVSCPRVTNCERPRRQDLGRPKLRAPGRRKKVERVLNECGMDNGESIHHLLFCMKMMVMIAKVRKFFAGNDCKAPMKASRSGIEIPSEHRIEMCFLNVLVSNPLEVSVCRTDSSGSAADKDDTL